MSNDITALTDDSNYYNLESVYDEQISPLMKQIITICKEHNMPMVASFAYENSEEKGRGLCTTTMTFEGRHIKEFADVASANSQQSFFCCIHNYMVERFSMNPVSCKLLNEAWKKEFPDEVAIAERMLDLLDENIQLQRGKDSMEAVALALRDDMRDAREKLESAERRIAELESYSKTAIEFREAARDENRHLKLSLEAVEGRVIELEARQIALPQRLSPEGYHIDEAYMVDDSEGEYLDRDAVIEAISTAGIKVKGE